MDHYQPRPKSNKKSRNIKGVHVSGYEDGDVFYVDYIHSMGGKSQIALEELKKDFKKIVALDPVAEARGFWDKMVERGIVDLLMYSVDFGDGRGEVMVPDADMKEMNESKVEKPSLRQVIDAYLKRSKHDPNDKEACFGTCKHQAYNLAKSLRKHGYEADLLQVSGPSPELLDKDIHPKWAQFLRVSDKARLHMIHYVVQVDDQIVDITGRQFGKKNSGSLIHPRVEFIEKWDKAHVIDRSSKIESTIMNACRDLSNDKEPCLVGQLS